MQKWGIALWFALGLSGAVGCEDCLNPPKNDGGRKDNQTVACRPDQSYDIGSAVDLAPGQTLDGTICPTADDKDYFRVQTGASDHVLNIHLWNDTGFTNVDLRAAVLNADGSPTQMMFSDSNGAGAPTDIRGAYAVLPSTTYIIEISDEGNDDFDSANPYHITIEFSAQPDTHETNDTVGTAASDVCTGQAFDGYIATRGDRDYFKCVASTKPARIKLAFNAGAELGWEPHLMITNDQGQALLDVLLTPDANGAYIYKASVAVTKFESNATRPEQSRNLSYLGDVTILVEDRPENNQPGIRYNYDATKGKYTMTLAVDTGPSGDTEPPDRNDSIGTATTVGGGQASGFLGTFGDVDWYKFTGSATNQVAEIQLSMPADGYVPLGIDADRLGVNLEIYDARLVVSGSTWGPKSGCEPGPADAVGLSGCSRATLGNDQCDDAYGEQSAICLPGGFCGMQRYSTLVLQGADANRVPLAATRGVGIAVRTPSIPTYIKVSHFGGTAYHENTPYTLSVNLATDPDGNEPNDLPPTLNREARYSSGSGEIRDCNLNHFTVQNIGSYSGPHACTNPGTPCPDGGPCPDAAQSGCLPWNDNSGIDGGTANGNPYTTINCSGVGSPSFTATGYLSYYGDRDYYTFTLPPGDIEVNIEFSTTAGTTGVETALFVMTDDGNRLKASYVDARMGNTIQGPECTTWQDCCLGGIVDCVREDRPCIPDQDGQGAHCQIREGCMSNTDCPTNYLCIGEGETYCFEDTTSHGAPDFNFGYAGGDCILARMCSDGNAWIVEVTDNGQNDYDLGMQYTLRVSAQCSCDGDRCSYCTAPLDYGGRTCPDPSR